MENNEKKEQPCVEKTILAEENSENTASETGEGSLLGKFNNVKDLEIAYENLQKEFTKKCQKLSELEKEMPEKNGDNENKISPPTKIDWQKEVENFLSQNKLAKENIAEISEEIVKQPTLANSENGLEQALKNVLAKKYKPVNEIIEDENFLKEHIFNNDKIKQKIIEEYLVQITSKKISPLIGEHMGSGISTLPKNKPQTFDEAGALVSRLIKG